MENIDNFEELLNDYLFETTKGDVKKGKILKRDSEFAYLEIGGKGEARVNSYEVEDYKDGDEIEVIVTNTEDKEGYVRVSRTAYEMGINEEKLQKSCEEGEVLEGKVEKKVNGGYIVDVLKFKAFMPNSLSTSKAVEGKKVKVVIKEIKEGKVKKIIVSSREIEDKEANQKMALIKEGDIVNVEIREVLEFGLTVDVNGLNGFIHVSEIAWRKVENLKELYKAGEKIDAKIIVADTQKKSIKLSIKQTKVDPWNKVAEKYTEGKEVKVKVLRIVNFGAFVEIEEGIEGLIHVSDLSWGKKVNIDEFVKPGDEITAIITDIKIEDKKIRLGVKQLKKDPWDGAVEKYSLGTVVSAKIVEVKEFGIFAEIEEGVDIFIHVSDLKWERAETAAYKVGDSIKAKIIEIDGDSKKIKGSVKSLEKSPWEKVSEKYAVGQKIKRKVESITNFGIFIEIENGIDGMIHISQASADFIKNLDERFKVGDEVEAEIIEIDAEHKKIKLSIKKIETAEQEKEEKELIEKYGTTE
jgi:small subunit ribosomal protein S1